MAWVAEVGETERGAEEDVVEHAAARAEPRHGVDAEGGPHPREGPHRQRFADVRVVEHGQRARELRRSEGTSSPLR